MGPWGIVRKPGEDVEQPVIRAGDNRVSQI